MLTPKRATDEGADEAPLRTEVLKLLAAMAVLVGGFFYLGYRIYNPPRATRPFEIVDVNKFTSAEVDLCGEPALTGWPVVVRMVYTRTMRPWLEEASNRFVRRCPNIQVKLNPVDGDEFISAVLNAEPRPTIVAPTSALILNWIEAHWQDKSKEVLFRAGDVQPLVRSPLIELTWDDVYQVQSAILDATKDNGEGEWSQSTCALVPRTDPQPRAVKDMVPGLWIDWYTSVFPPEAQPATLRKKPRKGTYSLPFPSTEDISKWGRVNFLSTTPTRSASGVEALYLLAYDFLLPPRDRVTMSGPGEAPTGASEPNAAEGVVVRNDHLGPAFQRAFNNRKKELQDFLHRCQAGRAEPPESIEELTKLMFSLGAENYDGVITFEHLTFPLLARIDAHGSSLKDLKVVYPTPTIVNEHPAALLWPDDPTRQMELDAARKWLRFLRSEEMQHVAIEHGFRPAIPEVRIRTHGGNNPFMTLRRYGVSFEEPLSEPPSLDGKALRDLTTLWEDATGRF